jgi:hypothetical protein
MAKKKNLKFRLIKYKLFLEYIKFLEYKISKTGIHTSKKKARVINKIILSKNSKKQYFSLI